MLHQGIQRHSFRSVQRAQLRISLDDKTVTITYNPAKVDEATLVKTIEKSGYSAEKAAS